MAAAKSQPGKQSGSGTRSRGGPRVRDSERTRRKLLDAAETIFAKNGLEGASTEAIARRAGVSKTMLFYYFHNKEELIIQCLKRSSRDLQRRWGSLGSASRILKNRLCEPGDRGDRMLTRCRPALF